MTGYHNSSVIGILHYEEKKKQRKKETSSELLFMQYVECKKETLFVLLLYTSSKVTECLIKFLKINYVKLQRFYYKVSSPNLQNFINAPNLLEITKRWRLEGN